MTFNLETYRIAVLKLVNLYQLVVRQMIHYVVLSAALQLGVVTWVAHSLKK